MEWKGNQETGHDTMSSVVPQVNPKIERQQKSLQPTLRSWRTQKDTVDKTMLETGLTNEEMITEL